MIRWIFALVLVANFFPVLLFGLPEDEAALSSTASRESDIPSLRLLEETDVGATAAPRKWGNASRCFRVGPVAGLTRAEEVAERLRSKDLQVETLWEETEAGADYWVHLPARASDRATSRLLRELQANRISSYVFSDGELEGAISLGVYGNKAAAREERSRFRELGYDAEIAAMARKTREYWLLVPGVGADVASLTRSTAADAGYPVKKSDSDCQAVASSLQLP